jgi:hypothetical protein
MAHRYIVVPLFMLGLGLLALTESIAASPASQPGPPGPPQPFAFWSLTGNSGTSAGTNFLGTTDNQPLELKVNNARALRLEPDANSPNLVGGVAANSVTGGAAGATIAGGGIAGVPQHPATPGPNRVTQSFGTVGGGVSNLASGFATVGGGRGNTASFTEATVGGGFINTASGSWATVGGGSSNSASVGGATVGGGSGNTASGLEATVPGGSGNRAVGASSFAAGHRAHANHAGTFVWADSTEADFTSLGANSFSARVSGGARFVDSAGIGVQLAPGGTSWGVASDRALKAHFTPVDGQAILERLMALSIETWSLRSQDPAVRHIGPMAQDFYTLFGLGEDDQHITTVDADGVALAAIQGLYQLVQEQAARLATEQTQNAALEARLVALEQALAWNGRLAAE